MYALEANGDDGTTMYGIVTSWDWRLCWINRILKIERQTFKNTHTSTYTYRHIGWICVFYIVLSMYRNLEPHTYFYVYFGLGFGIFQEIFEKTFTYTSVCIYV